jgi:hypothetical protein
VRHLQRPTRRGVINDKKRFHGRIVAEVGYVLRLDTVASRLRPAPPVPILSAPRRQLLDIFRGATCFTMPWSFL